MGLLDFIERGPERTEWLSDTIGGAVEYLTPPNLRPVVEMAAQFNPIQGMADSMTQFGVATDPTRSMEDRRNAAIGSAVEGLLAVVPAAMASQGYMKPAQATMEGLLGGSPAAQQIGDDLGRFWADEAGSLSWNSLPMYHGTPDVRELADAGGFLPRAKSISRLTDPDAWEEAQSVIGDITPGTSAYVRAVEEAGELMESANIKSPVFFSPDYRMASSYADDTRAWDYQNAVPEVIRADTSPQNILDVSAGGESFRGISRDRVKRALISAGFEPDYVDGQIRKYTHGRSGDRISTDDLAAISNDFGFDAVDVSNVKDDYYGGGPAGRVRMMLNMDQVSVPKYSGGGI